MVTIKDIAKVVGCTPATVSLALNGKGSISDKMRKKVCKVAQSMDYRPSNAAISLKTKKSYTLGFIAGSLRNEFFTDIISAVEDYAALHGYSILICDGGLSVKKINQSLKTLASRGVDGVFIALGFSLDDEYSKLVKEIMNDGVKVMAFSTAAAVHGVPLLDFDIIKELNSVASRLLTLNHKNVGIISGPVGSWMNSTRFVDTKNVLANFGLFNQKFVANSNMTIEDGKVNAMELLTKHKEITAVIALNDLMAIGALEAAKELGLRVPEDLSVVGIDGISYASIVTPNLTTISIPRQELGRLGAELMIDWIEERREMIPEISSLTSGLIEGKSLGKCREAK